MKAEIAERDGVSKETEVPRIDIIRDSALPHIKDEDDGQDTTGEEYDGELRGTLFCQIPRLRMKCRHMTPSFWGKRL